jgi:hypothetical protein
MCLCALCEPLRGGSDRELAIWPALFYRSRDRTHADRHAGRNLSGELGRRAAVHRCVVGSCRPQMADRIGTLTDQQRRDVLEILEDRHGARSTVVTCIKPPSAVSHIVAAQGSLPNRPGAKRDVNDRPCVPRRERPDGEYSILRRGSEDHRLLTAREPRGHRGLREKVRRLLAQSSPAPDRGPGSGHARVPEGDQPFRTLSRCS